MPKSSSRTASTQKDGERAEAWKQEQITKSLFFHQKLHEWGLLAVAQAVESFDGNSVEWRLSDLQISERAWNRVIHSGIAPVRVFAHPAVLQSIPRSVGYYRTLAMVSQKSMKRVNLDTEPYELGKSLPDEQTARQIARHLNQVICRVVETEVEPRVDARELDLWRAMAAGSQAQGAWQNAKGSKYEVIVRQLIAAQLASRNLIVEQDASRLVLNDEREVIFGADPDISLWRGRKLLAAVEVKGGIDPAGAHERLGASIKTLRDCRARESDCVTLLLLRKGTLTSGLEERLSQSKEDITRWFTIEDLLDDEKVLDEFINLFLQNTG
jgi:hypothetical protein